MKKFVENIRFVCVILLVIGMLVSMYLLLTNQINVIVFMVVLIGLIELCHIVLHLGTGVKPNDESDQSQQDEER